MTVFWIAAALILAGTLLLLLAPLRQTPRTALALALGIPAASVLVYLQLGKPQAVAPPTAAAAGAGSGHALTPEQLQQRASALAERLRAEPGHVQDWVMLGRSYVALARYRDAAAALRRAVDLGPPDAALLADLADVTGMAQGKRLAGEPARLIQQALDIDARHPKTLALAGSVAFEARDFAAARGYWQRLADVVPAGSDMARSVQVNIAQATRLEAGLQPVAERAPTEPGAAAASAVGASGASGAITGLVEISPELASRIQPGDTLFVFARAAQGPRMPLAIVRQPADGRPYRFRLDDSLAMSPALRLSGFEQVVVGARISRSGQALPQPGDLVGSSDALAPGAQGVRVLIDRVQ